MKNFLKENWFKVGILIAVLIMTFGISYYFMVSLPNKNDAETLTNLQLKCQELGEKMYQVEKQDNPDTLVIPPEYKFNKDLNTCIYSGGVIGISSIINKYIIDLYTNQEIISYAYDSGGTLYGNSDSWAEEYQKLFFND